MTVIRMLQIFCSVKQMNVWDLILREAGPMCWQDISSNAATERSFFHEGTAGIRTELSLMIGGFVRSD
jgi:hypothetical protein